jgi:hypothetical protein
MKDTASLTNALAENTTSNPKVGDTFAELLWTDRSLWVITEVRSPREFVAGWVETECKDGYEGTEYPVKNEDGSMKTYEGEDAVFTFRRHNWYKKPIYNGWDHEKNAPRPNTSKGWGEKVHLSFGESVGYRDPSF